MGDGGRRVKGHGCGLEGLEHKAAAGDHMA
jgi:hypothetical protein